MSRLNEYNRLKKEVEEDREEAARAEGELAGVMKRLKDEFDCPTIAIAKKQQKQLKKQAEEIKQEYDEKIEAYKNERIDNEER